jgi:uracil-DNA glycosylase
MKYFDPQNIRVIIIGQDPYTGIDQATGLSFSVPKDCSIPPSLKKIYKCLRHHKLIGTRPTHGNLVNWARQGVLLLNTYLTRSPNIISSEDGGVHVEGNGGSTKSNMHKFWGEFTNALLAYITDDFMKTQLNHNNHKLWVFLWGGHAQAVASVINTRDLPDGHEVTVCEWGHPSKLNKHNKRGDPENFKHCDHFSQVKSINWDPDAEIQEPRLLYDQFYEKKKNGFQLDLSYLSQRYFENPRLIYNDGCKSEEDMLIKKFLLDKKSVVKEVKPQATHVVAAIDGGCVGNEIKEMGRQKASYGVYFPKTFNSNNNLENLAGLKLYGLVPLTMMKSDKSGVIEYIGAQTKKTNGRGELLAAIHAIRKIINVLNETGPKPVILIGDAKYVIYMINEDIWKWLSKDPALKNVNKNRDLVIILCKTLITLSKLVPNFTDGKFAGKKAWDILIHPDAHSSRKCDPPVHLDWGGLTVLKIGSHLQGAKIPMKGSLEYELYECNEMADGLCKKAIIDIVEDHIEPVELHL